MAVPHRRHNSDPDALIVREVSVTGRMWDWLSHQPGKNASKWIRQSIADAMLEKKAESKLRGTIRELEAEIARLRAQLAVVDVVGVVDNDSDVRELLK